MTAIPAPEGAITEAELAKALANGPLRANAPDVLAAEILGHVLAGREPEYKPGETYEDDAGDRFMRLSEPPGGCWMELRANCSTALRGEDSPYRPLRKLVPLPDRDALITVLGETGTGDRWARVADKILALMEGGND